MIRSERQISKLRTGAALVVAMLATLSIAATGAQAAPKHLLITLNGQAVGPGEEVQANFEEYWKLTTTKGHDEGFCERYEPGSLTVNNSKKDVFTGDGEGEGGCVDEDPELGGLGGLQISQIVFGANGKATGAVDLEFSGPPPFQNCVYTGKLKGTNGTGGPLWIELGGKLKGSGCAEKTLVLSKGPEVVWQGEMTAWGGLPELDANAY